MRQQWIRVWAKKLLLAAVAISLPTAAVAQDAPDPRQGGASFAGGQMVRGTVTATAADHLTVKTEAGETYQISLSANTRLNKERQPIKVSDIKIGDGAGAMGVLDPATRTVHAVFVSVIDAEQVKKAREGMGKVYITGKVTAIDMDALKITVMRPDGVSQVIGVDEQTSFKRGGRGMAALASGAGVVDTGAMGARANGNGTGAGSGESITFADLKVGDSIAGRGTLKNGTFVPTELGVMDPAAMGQRRRRGAEGGAGAPPASIAPKDAAAPGSPAPSAAVPQ